MTSSSSPAGSPSKQKKNGPPPALAILTVYIVLGGIISFGFGRQPGSLPDNLLVELAPSMIVLTLFLTYYEMADCMGTGIARGMYSTTSGLVYQEYAAKIIPEPIYVAQRAQTNQIEQLPVVLVGTMACALFVNGTVAAVLSAIWSLLRIRYSIVYRAATGVTQDVLFRRIGTYTVPAYFCANALVIATTIHAIRCLL